MNRIGSISAKLKKKPYIYRIELLDRFYKILDNKEIVFVRPSTWLDPLENLIFNAQIIKNGTPYIHPVKDSIYSQCWSTEGDSYALWQIYTSKKNDQGEFNRHYGVRITTRIDKLKHFSELNKNSFYYGQMEYLWKYQLEALPKNPRILKALKKPTLNIEHLKTLLVKRKSYHYENELRLFGIPNSSQIDPNNSDICRFKIEPTELITSVRFDPAFPYSDFRIKKEELIDKYGFKPSQITQSTYFKKNKFKIDITGI
ncbi:MAG: hypothetical protein RLO17_01275 [Cyclobacteriaceae bacterium]